MNLGLHRSKNIKILILSVLTFLLSVSLCTKNTYAAITYDENEVKSEIEKIYGVRSSAFISGDIESLRQYFNTSKKQSQWALEHEVKRIKYLRIWSKQRGIEFKDVQSTIRIKKIRNAGDSVRVSLEESYKFDYSYSDDPQATLNSFGVGIRHSLTLTKKEDKWMLSSDWYTDCFEDALASITADIPTNNSAIIRSIFSGRTTESTNLRYKNSYDREKAVAYADKYCGAAWGSGNNYKYNPKYKDFTGIGGDCTNFASQVLGDKEAGGLPFGGGWHCSYQKYGNSEGSTAWANADGLKNYLLHSGKGSLIKIGTFTELTTPIADSPLGAVGKLKLGDLICYEKGRGNIDHFAVVTGFDSKGYPLVNSHTTDRYHVPWDLGWGDKKIRFFLMHING